MTGGAGHGDQCSAGGPDDNRAGDVEDSAEGGDVVRPLLPRPGGRRAGIRAAGAALIQVDDLGQLRELPDPPAGWPAWPQWAAHRWPSLADS
jgi:hypothetical protein